jgi:hypothetical protein
MTTIDRPRSGAPGNSARRFGITDLMGLVLAVACGLAIARCSSIVRADFESTSGSPFKSLLVRCANLGDETAVALMLLTPVTVILTVLRLHRNRTDFRRLMREPGFVACLAFGLGAIVTLTKYLLHEVVIRWAMPEIHAMRIGQSRAILSRFASGWGPFSSVAGLVVLASWTILWLGGRWRPEPTWVDRAGRVLGIVWIAMIPVQATFEVLRLFCVSGIL